ncbi:MAG: hypothetical protein EOO43_12295, partial [Flavobacterium sp.]
GTGYDSNPLKDFWEYNPLNNSWTQKADVGGSERASAVGFSIGNKGYIGTGIFDEYLKDFWEYNPLNNIWTQKADVGGPGRYGAVGFSIGIKGYIGTGNSGSALKDFWEYNEINNSWTQKADFAGSGRFMAIGFSIGNKGYIGPGSPSHNRKDFWEYDPNSHNLTQQGNNFNGVSQLVKTDTIGKIPATVLPTTTTYQGNTFNGNNQLVQTDAIGKISTTVLPANVTQQGNKFNGNYQLVQTDATGKIPSDNLPASPTFIANTAFLGIGVNDPKAPVHLTNSIINRKIILWQTNDNEHQFHGFGVNGNTLRYQVDVPQASHVFYAGITPTFSRELFRIKGDGNAILAGNLVTNGSSSSSDKRYKRDFSSIANPLNKVLQMNGFQYYWKQEEFKEKNFPATRQLGFIAQEVEMLFPELVETDEKGYKSVDYARLTPVLVEAIKELKKENDRIINENIGIREQSAFISKENASIRKDVESLKTLILQVQNGK